MHTLPESYLIISGASGILMKRYMQTQMGTDLSDIKTCPM